MKEATEGWKNDENIILIAKALKAVQPIPFYGTLGLQGMVLRSMETMMSTFGLQNRNAQKLSVCWKPLRLKWISLTRTTTPITFFKRQEISDLQRLMSISISTRQARTARWSSINSTLQRIGPFRPTNSMSLLTLFFL